MKLIFFLFLQHSPVQVSMFLSFQSFLFLFFLSVSSSRISSSLNSSAIQFFCRHLDFHLSLLLFIWKSNFFFQCCSLFSPSCVCTSITVVSFMCLSSITLLFLCFFYTNHFTNTIIPRASNRYFFRSSFRFD